MCLQALHSDVFAEGRQGATVLAVPDGAARSQGAHSDFHVFRSLQVKFALSA